VTSIASIFVAAAAVSISHVSLRAGGEAKDVALPAEIRPLLEAHCIDCHDGPRGKGGLDLAPALERNQIGEAPLRALRKRLAKRDMPPADEEIRPTREEYAAAVAAIDAVVAPTTREVPNVRRLNRAQYAGSVHDVFGVDAADVIVERMLPADEIGEGFDTTGDTLALPPLLLEKYFDIAEAIAAEAVPDARPRRIVVSPERLERRGQGGTYDGLAWLSTNGTLRASVEIVRAGRYRITVDVAAQQAGDALARMALLADEKSVREEDITADRAKPQPVVWEGELAAGARMIGVRFLNDFWDPNAPDRSRRDRNLGVGAMVLEGPLDPPPPSAFEVRALEAAGEGGEAARLRRLADTFGARLFRRELTQSECDALATIAREAAIRQGDEKRASWKAQLRALVTALLVDPRFLLRIEVPADEGGRRPLSGDELASRLAFFLWSSVPDEELSEAASRGELATADGLALQARRMLRDPRASTLASRFAAQWLGIDGLALREFDPKLYPSVDRALLTSMRRETELLFESVVRGELPVRTLISSRKTFVDARLAQHYGVVREAADASAFVAVEVPETRPSGVLGHGSILLATSNPTRTSPVKRGKWVLDALLDEAPPPPPPGVPQLPETREEKKGLSIRELMALHRANPDCASCHIQMDALGLAFERIDVDGRLRDAVDGEVIDDRTELPDGSILAGVAGVERFLEKNDGFERAVARRLLVYALGRGTADADDALVDNLAKELRAHGAFTQLVEGIVRSDAFRTRVDSPKAPVR